MITLQHESVLPNGNGGENYVKAAFLAHDPMLEVKKSYAEKMEKEAIRDLVNEKKGILILDLDHTLFQVTLRPITKENPGFETWNFETELKHSGKLLEEKTYWFNLDSSPNASPFFLHLRPGMYSFLTEASTMFELYAYTQGTNEYARKILGAIDPNGEFFGTPFRLIAREIDPNTGHATRKNLSRVFPNEEDLVLIIDDRDDVWDSTRNLIKLTPFLFFQDPEREKLFGLTPTSDPSFCPYIRHHDPSQPARVVDTQLKYLENVLADLHAEVFFGASTPSFPSALEWRKSQLFSNMLFHHNPRVGGNVYKIIKQYGGQILRGGIPTAAGTTVNLGVLGQSRRGDEPELIHPWFVLFAISTLSVPALPEIFSVEAIERDAVGCIWEQVPDVGESNTGGSDSPTLQAQDELDLLEDLLS